MTRSDTPDADTLIPVLQEHATVYKRTVTTGVTSVEKRVESQDYLVSEVLQRTDVSIERVLVGTPVDADNPPSMRTEDGITIIPILEEVLVVEKRLILKEELRIRHLTDEVPTTQAVSLRSETVEVKHSDGSASPDNLKSPLPESEK